MPYLQSKLIQLLINTTMVLVKTLSTNVTVSINVLLEINLMKKNTKLSKYVRELKERDINYFTNLDIAMKSQKNAWGSQKRKCDLCICEKLLIARADTNVLLNKRDGLVLKCQHRNNLF